MKKINLTLAVALLCTTAVNANVLTASNNPAQPAQYNDLQAACDVASAGDTIYIYGSPNQWGEIHIYQPLTIIGSGINPANAFSVTTYIGYIRLHNSSEGGDASGTHIIGLGRFTNITLSDQVNNVIIERCSLGSVEAKYININSGIILKQNIIAGIYFQSSTLSGIISNNIIDGISVQQTSSGLLIVNNDITNHIYVLGGIIVANNILIPTATTGAENCIFNNNISSSTLPFGNNTGTGNILIASAKAIKFVSFDGNIDNLNNNYNLQANSPAKNAGTDGTDIGVTGGSYPFDLKKQNEPAIPQVRYFNIGNSVVPANTNLQINSRGESKN